MRPLLFIPKETNLSVLVHNGLYPFLLGHLLPGEGKVREVVVQMGFQLGDVHGLLVHVVLLGTQHGQVLVLLASVLAVLDASDHLLVDEISGHVVLSKIVISHNKK